MENNTYDVIIAGGGVAASVLSLRLRELNPEIKILIVEQSTSFIKKVGESSSDITGLFFRTMKLEHIQSKQLKKAGLRFFFPGNSPGISHAHDYSSPSYPSIANAWQMNRSDFDQTLLDECKKKGCDILRPAQVIGYEYAPFQTKVMIEEGETKSTYTARWFVDATGRRSLVANNEKWRVPESEPNTAASWAHFKNLRPISDLDRQPQKTWEKVAISPRQDATTHFMGKGYWVWHITLNDNTTSIGLVYDKRIINTENQHPKEFYNKFIKEEPLVSTLLQDENFEGFRHYPHLPYRSTKYLKPGIATLGDASFFIDPLFSPGIEIICQQALNLSLLIADEVRTKKWCPHAEMKYEKKLHKAYTARIELYKKKYYFMGDYESFSLITQLEFAAYFTYYIFPMVLFRSRLKDFPRIEGVGLFLYRWFSNHLLKATLFRESLSYQEKKWFPQQTFTGVRIPVPHIMPKVIWDLNSRAIGRWLVYEWNFLKWKWKRQS